MKKRHAACWALIDLFFFLTRTQAMTKWEIICRCSWSPVPKAVLYAGNKDDRLLKAISQLLIFISNQKYSKLRYISGFTSSVIAGGAGTEWFQSDRGRSKRMTLNHVWVRWVCFSWCFPLKTSCLPVEPRKDACSKCHRLSLLQEPVSNGIVEVACELCWDTR